MPIRPGAQAWSVDGDDRIGVLLLHGFTGSPASMRPWGEQPPSSRGRCASHDCRVTAPAGRT